MRFDYIYEKYKKNNILNNYGMPNNSPIKKLYDFFIIIPAYKEKNYIENTLESIADQKQSLLNRTLIVIVINNSNNDNQSIVQNNLETLQLIVKKKYNFEIITIDCFTKQFALH